MQKHTCKHYTGSYHNTHCAVGVCYRDVTNDPDGLGSAYRIACMKPEGLSPHGLKVLSEHGPQGVCDKYDEPTNAEVAEFDREVEALMEQHIKEMTDLNPILLKIKKEHKGKGHQCVIECPRCKGKLHLSHAASNGHIWGKCETEDCMAWME